MTQLVYLDNSATTKVAPEVMAAMQPYWYQDFANPSSPHHGGVTVERTLRECRQYIAQQLGIAASELIFTSGGTESNNLALQGVALAQRVPGHLITSAIEHPSVLHVAKFLAEQGWQVTYLPVDSQGLIRAADLCEAINPKTRIVSIMLVNNEIGTIQPVQEIGRIIKAENKQRQDPILFHVDAIQGLGNVPVTIEGIDLLSLSGHKICGPKGIGLLYRRNSVRLRPLFFGGGQEGGFRSGTENVPGIVGLTKAIQLSTEGLSQRQARLAELRDKLWSALAKQPDTFFNSPLDGAPHIVNVGFANIPSEVFVHFLEQRGIYVSMGAACSSKKAGISHVLQAIGLPPAKIASSIRISLAPTLSDAEITHAIQMILQAAQEIRAIYQ